MQIAKRGYFDDSKKYLYGKIWEPTASPSTNANLKYGYIQYDPFRFKIYVSDKKGFEAVFKKPFFRASSSSLVSERLDLKSNYIASIASMYVATRKCGICSIHLNYNNNVPKQITSMMRYHVVLTFQRLMDNRDLLASLINGIDKAFIFANIPGSFGERTMLVRTGSTIKNWLASLSETERIRIRNPVYSYSRESVRMIKYKKITTMYEGNHNDFLQMVSNSSDGITPFGQRLLGKSLMVFTYCVVGAQANTGEPIVGKGTISLATQDRFKRLHLDHVKALENNNLVRDTATALTKVGSDVNRDIIRGFIRVPSNMLMFNVTQPKLIVVTDTSDETVTTSSALTPALASTTIILGIIMSYF